MLLQVSQCSLPALFIQARVLLRVKPLLQASQYNLPALLLQASQRDSPALSFQAGQFIIHYR